MRKLIIALPFAAVALWLLYLLLGNLLIATPLLRHLTNRHPDQFILSYRYAYTLWPGVAHVSGYRMTVQTPPVSFDLEVDDATAHIALRDLTHRRFRTTRVRSTGVSYRMITRPRRVSARLLAYPHLRGAFPLRPVTREPKPTKEQIDGLWSVELGGVDSTVRELWVDEFHWRGRGRATGAFGLKPLRWVWVGPCTLDLAPGDLTIGENVVSHRFGGHADTTLDFVEIPEQHQAKMLEALQSSGTFAGDVASLDFLSLYGLAVRGGEGHVRGSASVKDGVLEDGSQLEVELDGVRGVFEGGVHARGAVERGRPQVRARFHGAVQVPLPDGDAVKVETEHARAELLVNTGDFTEPWRPVRLGLNIERLEARDLRPIWALRRAPFYASLLFGNGPLTARGFDLAGTPQDLRLRVDQAHLGEARVKGHLEVKRGRASGELLGALRELPIGVTFGPGETKVRLFPQ